MRYWKVYESSGTTLYVYIEGHGDKWARSSISWKVPFTTKYNINGEIHEVLKDFEKAGWKNFYPEIPLEKDFV